MIILSEAVLAALWILMALWHAYLIKHNRPILHGLWALLAGVFIAAATWCVWPRLDDWQRGEYIAAQLIARTVVFNVSLNLFRGLKWDYTSPTSTSILDSIERRLFGGRVWLLEVILAILFFILQYVML